MNNASMNNWVTEYLQDSSLSKRSREIYRLGLLELDRFMQLENLSVSELETVHIRKWLGTKRQQGSSVASIALLLSTWRVFFEWLRQHQWIIHNPMLGVKPPKKPLGLPKSLSVEQAQQLIKNGFPQSTKPAQIWLNCRDKALLELLYSSGLRAAEICQLDWKKTHLSTAWVDLSAKLVWVMGKGDKQRLVPIGSYALEALGAWLEVRPSKSNESEDHALFTGANGRRLTYASIWSIVRKRGFLAQLKMPIHPHQLRHSFASHILQSGANLRAVQELLGHANLSSTQIYTSLDFQKLAQAYDKAHPRAK
ncbi:MAG: tyrosine-type recombinase/integrase [Gammaproteobacteria bacterium]|nr:tyrosine-type recombinase/integrase [Gammaproteobacteria bacterium]